jgi:hypothetical protein
MLNVFTLLLWELFQTLSQLFCELRDIRKETPSFLFLASSKGCLLSHFSHLACSRSRCLPNVGSWNDTRAQHKLHVYFASIYSWVTSLDINLQLSSKLLSTMNLLIPLASVVITKLFLYSR